MAAIPVEQGNGARWEDGMRGSVVEGEARMLMLMATLYSRVAYFQGVMQVTLISPANCEAKQKQQVAAALCCC